MYVPFYMPVYPLFPYRGIIGPFPCDDYVAIRRFWWWYLLTRPVSSDDSDTTTTGTAEAATFSLAASEPVKATTKKK